MRVVAILAVIVEPALERVVHRHEPIPYLLLGRWPDSTHQALEPSGQGLGIMFAGKQAIDLLIL
jgi:hypothetical protein